MILQRLERIDNMKVSAWYKCRHCGARQDIECRTASNAKQARTVIAQICEGANETYQLFAPNLTHKCNENTWSIMDLTAVIDIEET